MLTDFIGVLYSAGAESSVARAWPAAYAQLSPLPGSVELSRAGFRAALRSSDVAQNHAASPQRIAITAGLIEPCHRANSAQLLDSPTDADKLNVWLKQRDGGFCGLIFETGDHLLRVVRDSIGHEPLYYIVDQRYVAVSTSFKALHAFLADAATIDESGFAESLALAHQDLERTVIREIKRLPPAHWMDLKPACRSQPRRYWRLDETSSSDGLPAASQLRAAVIASIADKCTRVTRPALLLSGGLDSSALCAAFHHGPIGTPPLHAYGSRTSAVFGSEAAPDETHYMQALAAQYPSMRLTLLKPDRRQMLDEIDAGIQAIGFPYRDIYSYEMRAMFSQAAADGCDLVLTGIGGDIFASAKLPAFYAHLLLGGRLKLLRTQANREFAPRSARDWAQILWGHAIKPALRRPRAALTPQWVFARKYGLGSRALPLHSGFARRSRYYQQAQRAYIASLPDVFAGIRHNDASSAESALVVHLLEYFAAMSRSIGLHIASPLLDRRVIQCIYHTPETERRSGRLQRSLIRTAFRDWLPPLIAERQSKGNFSQDVFGSTDLAQLNAAMDRLRSQKRISEYVAVDELARIALEKLAAAQTPLERFEALFPVFIACSAGSFLEINYSQ